MKIAISVNFRARIVFDSSKRPGEEWYLDSEHIGCVRLGWVRLGLGLLGENGYLGQFLS